MSETAGERVRVEGPRCPYCHAAVRPGDEKLACDGCMAWHHAGCWRDHGTCAACGHVARAVTPEAPARTAPRPGTAAKASGRGAEALSADFMMVIGVLNVGLMGGLGLAFPGLGLLGAIFACLGAVLAVWGFRLRRREQR